MAADGNIELHRASELEACIRDIIKLERGKRGWLMRAVQGVGSLAEGAMTKVMHMTPVEFEKWAADQFETLYELSARADEIKLVRESSTTSNTTIGVITGAASGALGFMGLLADLPITTANIFNAIRKVARKHGFDPSEDDVRMACLEVFVSGGPDKADDGVDASMIASKMAINGTTLSNLLSRASNQYVARLMTVLGPRAVPVLGALAGGAVNAAFISYYENVAEIIFRLKRLQLDNPNDDVIALYQEMRARPGRAITG